MIENLPNEEWRDIPDYEGLYQVSNLGRVKSLPKEWIGGNGAKLSHNGKILIQISNSRGYLKVGLSKHCKKKFFSIHKLVAMAFLGHKPNGNEFVVDHIDNNQLNNNLSNLQIVTPRHNSSKDRKNKTSKYTGVSWNTEAKKWVVQIVLNGKKKYLGCFDCELKAHLAYQKALKQLV